MTNSNSVVQLPGSKIIPAEAVAGVAIFPRFSAEERAQGLTISTTWRHKMRMLYHDRLDEVLQGVREQRLAASQSIELARAV